MFNFIDHFLFLWTFRGEFSQKLLYKLMYHQQNTMTHPHSIPILVKAELKLSHPPKMASQNSLPTSATNVLHCPIIDETFDLDGALPMITYTSSAPSDQEQQKSDHAGTISELMVSNLPTVAATQGVCMVCMENFQQAFPGRQLPCSHMFHATCISSWISLSNSCPVCRSGVPA